jgi:hypothetical protein
VLNINAGRNEEIVRRSKALAGYSAFIGKAREYEELCGDKLEAVKRAARYCFEHDMKKDWRKVERKAK